MPFVPHFLLRDMVGWYIALGILAALAALFPWQLGEKADPFGSAPEGIRPEWYFLSMFQTLKHLPQYFLGLEGDMVGVLFFNFCGLMVLVVPFVDYGAMEGQRERLHTVFAVMVYYLATVWGLVVTHQSLNQVFMQVMGQLGIKIEQEMPGEVFFGVWRWWFSSWFPICVCESEAAKIFPAACSMAWQR